MLISTLISGYFAEDFVNFGLKTDWKALSPAVIRMVPAGFPRSSLTAANLHFSRY